MGWFSNNNNEDNSERKREIEYEIKDLQSKYDSLNREIYYASDKKFSFLRRKDKKSELEYWDTLEAELIETQYSYKRKIRDLEYELNKL